MHQKWGGKALLEHQNGVEKASALLEHLPECAVLLPLGWACDTDTRTLTSCYRVYQ